MVELKKLSDDDFVRHAFFSCLRPSTNQPLDEWAEANVRLPHSAVSDRLNLSLTPYLREPIRYASGREELSGTRVDKLTLMAAVQSSKSTLEEAVACFAIAEDGGPLMWNYQSDGDATEAAQQRIWRMFKATKAVKDLLPKKYRTMMINFPHMPFIIQGAEAKTNLQSKSIRWQLNDETWMWPRGHLDEAFKRCTAYWNRMIINVSTGAVENDDTDVIFKEADQREWMFTCDKCGRLQKFQIMCRDPVTGYTRDCGLTWDNIEFPDGSKNIPACARTARYQCSCGKTWKDSAQSRRDLNKLAKYVAQNAHPMPGTVSFHYPAMCVEWISWMILVMEWLKANAAMKAGVSTPLREFVQKRLGESWRERATEEVTDLRAGDFAMLESWNDEDRRYMAVDVQGDHFWALCRVVADDGRSRLVWCGKIQGTYDDVRAKQFELGVADKRVLIDCSYGQGARGPRSVYYQCCMFGWTALAGDHREYFSIIDKRTKKPVRSAVSGMSFGDPLSGAKHSDGYDAKKMKLRVCPLFRWSNPTIKDILENLWRKRGVAWDIPIDVPQEWHDHMRAEIRQVVANKQTGRPEVKYVLVDRKGAHLRDCECMILAAVVKSGVLGADVDAAAAPDPTLTSN